MIKNTHIKRYNIIDEKWIPCLMLDQTYRDVSIRELYDEIENIQEIHHQNSTVLCSLYRFILALTQTIYYPETIDEWKNMLVNFDKQKAYDYLDKWYDRFWLIHPEYPFWQCISDELFSDINRRKPLNNLFIESQLNILLFNHVFKTDEIDLKTATQRLISTQYHSFGCPGNMQSPSITGYTTMISSISLLKTIHANMIIEETGYDRILTDQPIWEKDDNTFQKTCYPGILELWTWKTRNIYLHYDEKTDKITECWNAPGDVVIQSYLLDTLFVYTIKKDKTISVNPKKLSENKTIWMEIENLLISTDENIRLNSLSNISLLDKKNIYRLVIHALINVHSDVKSYNSITLPIPIDLLASTKRQSVEEKIKDMLSAVNDYEDKIKEIFKEIIKYMLPHTDKDDNKNKNKNKKHEDSDSKALSNFEFFWNRINTAFYSEFPKIDTNYDVLNWERILRQNGRMFLDFAFKKFAVNPNNLKAYAIAKIEFYKFVGARNKKYGYTSITEIS